MFIYVLLSHAKLGALAAGIIGENFIFHNGRITEFVGLRATSGDHLGPTPLPRQGQLEQVTQEHVQLCFESRERHN